MSNVSCLTAHVPIEILQQIFSNLTLREITLIRRVCRLFNELYERLGGIVEITTITPHTCFVTIDDNLSGIIHINNLKEQFNNIQTPNQVLKTGDKVRAIVIRSAFGLQLNLTNETVRSLKTRFLMENPQAKK